MSEVYWRPLSSRLGVGKTTLHRWAVKGCLTPARSGFYDSRTLDIFLAKQACFFGEHVPTWNDLASRRIVLVTLKNAARHLGYTEAQLRSLCTHFLTPYIKLPGHDAGLRFSWLHMRQAVADLKPCVSVQPAMLATGFADRRRFRLAPGIEVAYNPLRTSDAMLYITEQSFKEYLRTHLPSWITVDEWIEECRDLKEPLKSPTETQALLGLPRRQLMAFLNERGASYILRSDRGHLVPYVLPAWVREELKGDAPLTEHDVAVLFDVHPQAVSKWLNRGWIVCRVEGHAHSKDDPYLKRACWWQYLRQNCSPGGDRYMQRFLTCRLAAKNPRKLLTTGDIARRLGCHHFTVERWAAEGRLVGFRTLGGNWRFDLPWLERAMTNV